MKVDEPVALAEIGDVPLRLVISRQYINAPGAALHQLRHFIQPPSPAHQVARREIVVGIYVHQALQSLSIIMNVGKDQKARHDSDTMVVALIPRKNSMLENPTQPNVNSWLEDELFQQYKHDRKTVDATWTQVLEGNGHTATPSANGNSRR